MSEFLTDRKPKPHYDVVLIGGGITSATLATLLHELDPNLEIGIFERSGTSPVIWLIGLLFS